MELQTLLNQYVEDPENPQRNLELARCYDSMGQTAAAASFYIRASERTQDDLLAYDCLVHASQCFATQGTRGMAVRSLLQHAISLVPDRPEAYYFLSKYYELYATDNANSNSGVEAWFYCYMFACVGVQNIEKSTNTVSDYPGKYGLLFQKALSAWWCGRGSESRTLLQDLANNYWDKMDQSHKNAVETNLMKLGAGPVSEAYVQYDKSQYEKLRYQFPNSRQINKNYSQAAQDLFVLSMLNGKENGTFLEIGGGDPFHGNNTALLESEFGWEGVSIELSEDLVKKYREQRPTRVWYSDALQLDYKELLSVSFDTKVIDYLQLDIEPARNTYECLLRIPFDEYRFAVITYEHDYTVDTTKSFREKSRNYLRSKGYVLVVNDVSPNDEFTFEDWWVHPDLVDPATLSKMKSVKQDGVNNIKDYMFSGQHKGVELMEPKKPNFNINTNPTSSVWVVDNFYQDPHAVREFALKQEYFEGGFGRGFIGRRSKEQFLFDGLKDEFEDIMGYTITKWGEHDMNGRFQIAWAGEPLVYHCDSQKWAGMLFLTPDAPYQCGTTLHANKKTRARTYNDPGWDDAWVNVPGDPHLDGTPFEPVDVIGNVFNRLVIFDASCIHSASEYFGTVHENARLWQMFFFD